MDAEFNTNADWTLKRQVQLSDQSAYPSATNQRYMKYFVYILLLIVLCGLQAGLAQVVNIRGQTPQLLFLLVFVWSLDKNDRDYLFLTLGAGLFLDFYSGVPVGSITLPLLAISLLLHQLVENFLALELSPKLLAALLLPAQAVFYVLYFFCLRWLPGSRLPVLIPGLRFLAGNFVIAFAYNLLFLYPVFLLVEFVRSFIHRHFEREYKIQ